MTLKRSGHFSKGQMAERIVHKNDVSAEIENKQEKVLSNFTLVLLRPRRSRL
jgi:hypothetical protein